MNAIKRLEVYAARVRMQMDNAKNEHKKAFFKRELLKTLARIAELQK